MVFSLCAINTISVSAAEKDYSISTTAVEYQDVPANANYYDAVKMLSTLDIFQGDDLGNFNPDKTITRAEATAVVVRLLGYEGMISQTATSYVDVPASHWASGYIQTGTALGFINGYGFGYFGPEDPVKYEQMITMLVRALGYEKKIEYENGVYPGSYLSTAAQYDILSKVGGTVGEPAPRKVVASLVHSALSAPLMEQISYGAYAEFAPMDGSSSARPLKNILIKVFDTHMVRATVTTTEISSLDSTKSMEKGYAQVEIYAIEKGDYEFEEEDVITIKDNGVLKDYLGAPLTLYLRANDNLYGADYELVDFTTDNRKFDEEIIDDVANIEFGSNATRNFGDDNDSDPVIAYWDDNRDKTVSFKVEDDATILLNGSYYANAKDSDMSDSFFEIPYGKVVLRDTDDNNKFDMIFVTKYSTYVVSELNTRYQKIYDKNNYNPTITLDPEDDDLVYTILLNGREIAFEDLRENDVLTVTADKVNRNGKIDTAEATNYLIEVSRDTIQGTIKQIDSDLDNEYNIEYKIDGSYYKAIPEIAGSLSLSDEGTFFLDKFGRIANYEVENTSTDDYAYVLSVGNYTSRFEEEIYLKVMTSTGKVETLVSNAKGITIYDEDGDSHSVMIDATGTKEDLFDDGWDEILEGSMITYDENASGELKKVYLPRTGSARDERYFSFNKSMTDARYNEKSETIGNVLVDDSTVVFFIPDWTLDSDEITVSSINALEDDEYYDVYVYHMDKNSVAGLLVVNGDNDSVAIKDSVYVVDSIIHTLNDDNDRVQAVKAFHDGESVVLLGTVDTDLSDLDEGDVVSFSLNANDEISKYAIYVDYDETELFDTKSFRLNGSVVEDLEVAYGFVTDKRNTSIAVSVDPDATPEYLYGKNANVYMYNDRMGRVEVADWADIEEYEDNEDMFVFVRIYEGSITDVVIYEDGDPILPEIEDEEEPEVPVEPETPAEPEVPTYTVTFIADGVAVDVVEFEEGATSIVEPTVPAKEGYTGVWSSYTLGTSNIYVTAIYTAIEAEPETPVEPEVPEVPEAPVE
jgi:hypothetical protein